MKSLKQWCSQNAKQNALSCNAADRRFTPDNNNDASHLSPTDVYALSVRDEGQPVP